jgi:hypothetical protein
VLCTGKPFQDRTAPPLLNEKQKERLIRHHIWRLGKLGIAVHRDAPLALAKNKCRPFAEIKPPKRGKGSPPQGSEGVSCK